MSFVPHLLYMFDFVVDDVVITRKNHCAPEEYPTCVELTFRSNAYVSICDREYGGCVEPRQPQCGKCCIFPLESPVTEEDRLLIHVYKKRSNRCKFLIGLAEMKVKSLFDKIDQEFNTVNWNWLGKRQENRLALPTFSGSNKDELDGCDCFNDEFRKLEQLCPSYVMAKRMLPLFNLCQEQAGNIVLVLRLLCHGPTLVSAFTQVGNKLVPVKRPADQDPCKPDPKSPLQGYRYFACNADKLCPYDVCEDEFDRNCPTVPCKCRCPRAVEQQDPCGDSAPVPMFPRFRYLDKLSAKKQKSPKSKTKSGKKD